MSGISTSVLLRPHKKGTRMEISQRVGLGSTMAESIVYSSILTFFIAVTTGAIAKSLLIGGLSAIGLMALFVPLIYWLDTRWREKKHNQLNELADQIQDILMSDVAKTMAAEKESSRLTSETSSSVDGDQRSTEKASLLDENEALKEDVDRDDSMSTSRQKSR